VDNSVEASKEKRAEMMSKSLKICTSKGGDPLPSPTRKATSATADLRACRREWATPSDRKRQSASDTHGDYVEHGTRRVWGGASLELRNPREMVRNGEQWEKKVLRFCDVM